jgi:carbon monoxide dehydrogenase subunit G
MGRVAVRTTIAAPPEVVWGRLEDLGDHVRWMADAEAVTFTGSSRYGVGTTFDCTTRVGPIRLTDRMEVVEWDPPAAMGVRHTGVVTGTGRFTLRPAGAGGGTELAWEEELRFPWWLGGRLGEAVAGPLVLRRIWTGNLARLRRLVER